MGNVSIHHWTFAQQGRWVLLVIQTTVLLGAAWFAHRHSQERG